MTKWYITETPCYPDAWKVTYNWRGEDFGSNAGCHFFRTQIAAQKEADKRNANEGEKG